MQSTVKLAQQHAALKRHATRGVIGDAALEAALDPYRGLLRRLRKRLRRRRARTAMRETT